MEPARPDPDVLLQQVQAEEQRRQRGRLKVFFGATAGVGKTYAMLEAARARRAEGLDVLVGVVEAHGRKETEALLQSLDVLPPRWVEYRNTKLREFDLGAALARKPAIILMDELAHTNAPGSKNAKRWEDVKELLGAGISVYTTINVQHLESLNDVVARITHVVVRETVPDSIFDEADEVELIDLPPDDLLQRLKQGKVYLGEQAAERAAEHFFRKGNLIALRELALRRTADRVNRQAESYRQEKSISGIWPTAERILVCVGPSPFSARVIRAARRMAAAMRAEWIAVSVETPAQAGLPEKDRERTAQNMHLAEQLGAETITLTGTRIVDEILAYARKRSVTKIVMGKPERTGWRERLFGSVADDLFRHSGEIDVFIIKGEADESQPKPDLIASTRPVPWLRYGSAVGMVILCTGIDALIRFVVERAKGTGALERPGPVVAEANLVMVYLAGVVLVASRWGRGPAVLASVLSVAAFDFFFVPPSFTFAVADAQYVFTFAVMLGVALLFSSLTAQIKAQVTDASTRERRTAALYAMTRQLSSSRGTQRLLDIAARHVSQVFESDVVGLMPDASGRLDVMAGNEAVFSLTARERGVAQWVFDTAQSAGLGTETLPSAEALYIPLIANRGSVGVLGIRPARLGRPLSVEQMNLLETFASQAALAIECDRLADEANASQVQAETEKSRNALLSSVSHDLRTPLAGICGAASSLLEGDQRLTPAARQELAESIYEQSNRMSRLVTNLLEMTKLESGAVKVNKEPCPLEEVVGGALTRLEKTLDGREVSTRIPADFPLVPVDVVLLEQVFFNLLDNAAKYTPPKSAIEITASMVAGDAVVEVSDHGPGLAAGDEKRVFEKFYRGNAYHSAGGVGLGLAICRAIVEAHGGKISAANRAGGGAAFRFSLPLGKGTASSEERR
ncbi:MAG TPA: sensor histidine kinase KdpD [Planctomycetota bacterium]|jgi:two-component system sensor histidine kinase KdpD